MSSSRSSQAQTVNQTDNRRVIGQGAASAEGGSTITIQTLDGEAINRAFQYAGDTGSQAFELVGGTLAEALGFGGKALDAALNAQGDALAFAEANARLNTTQAYNFAADALGGAFGFGDRALDRASDAMSEATSLVKDAYADAKGRGALTDKILMGAIAAMAVVALMAVKK